MGSRLGGGRLEESRGQELVRPLGKEKYIGRIKTPETRFIMAALLPLPIFFRRKEEERVEWHGEYQHQMLPRRQRCSNDGYLIDNLPRLIRGGREDLP